MSCNSLYSHASRAHGPAVMPHQQLVCPEVLFVPAVARQVGQQARRIRGGCCCPGGALWVPDFSGSRYDHDEEMRQQGQSVRQSWSTQQRHSLPRSVSSDDEAEQAQYARPQVRFSLSPSSPSPPSTPPANLRPQSPGGQSGISGTTLVAVESNPSFLPTESAPTLPKSHEGMLNPPKPNGGEELSKQPRKVPFRRIRSWVKEKCPLEIDWQR